MTPLQYLLNPIKGLDLPYEKELNVFFLSYCLSWRDEMRDTGTQ